MIDVDKLPRWQDRDYFEDEAKPPFKVGDTIIALRSCGDSDDSAYSRGKEYIISHITFSGEWVVDTTNGNGWLAHYFIHKSNTTCEKITLATWDSPSGCDATRAATRKFIQ